MAQNSQALDLAEAINQLSTEIPALLEHEVLPLAEAQGRILADDLHAPLDMPPFAASAMDGYAVRQVDFDADPDQRFHLIGRSLAGNPCNRPLHAGQAIRIFTGAQMPLHGDLVLLQEEAQASTQDGPNGAGSYISFKPHKPTEAFVRPLGHDVRRGALIATQGQIISAFLLGALTSVGISQVVVVRRLKIGVFSTGDELVDADTPPEALKAGQIYDSNRATVLALLTESLFQTLDLGRIPDNLQRTKTFLTEASERVDVLITSGGVSVGDADFVTRAIEELGELKIWKLNLKPGKPMAIGTINGCTVFGLPGNPVSTIVTLLLVAKPVMLNMMHCRESAPLKLQATLQNDLQHRPGRTEFQRGTLEVVGDKLVVSSTGDQSSNRLNSFANANCLIEIDQTVANLSAQSLVPTIPFWGLIRSA